MKRYTKLLAVFLAGAMILSSCGNAHDDRGRDRDGDKTSETDLKDNGSGDGEAGGANADGSGSGDENPEPEKWVPFVLEKLEFDESEYPAPKYDFDTEEVTLEMEGITREYRIAVVNDIHMITDKESGDVWEDYMPTLRTRHDYMFITGDGVYAEDLWPEIVKYLNHNDFDAILFAGDLIDYCSNSNITALKNGLNELRYPADRMLYIRSDHDYGAWYGGNVYTEVRSAYAQTYLFDSDRDPKYLDLGEFGVIGYNRSYRNMYEEEVAYYEEKMDGEQPLIFLTHVPFYSDVDESLYNLSMEVRQKIYYWSNDEGAGYRPDANTQKIIDKMYNGESNVQLIVAAHMHESWDGQVSENMRQHIYGPDFRGQIGILHITPKSE